MARGREWRVDVNKAVVPSYSAMEGTFKRRKGGSVTRSTLFPSKTASVLDVIAMPEQSPLRLLSRWRKHWHPSSAGHSLPRLRNQGRACSSPSCELKKGPK